MDYYTEKMQHGGLGFREYVEALEEERRKIQVFQRELPLCLELVNQAIDACRQQMSGTTTENNLHGQSESSEQTTSNEVVPAFEEFIPMKRSSDLSDDDEEEHSHDEDKREKINNNNNNDNNSDKKKSDWLRSVQLWHPSSDPPLKEDVPRKTTVMEVKRNGGAFQPFHREKSVGKSNVSVVGKLPAQAPVAAPAVAVATTSSSAETASGGRGGGGGSEIRDEKDGQSQRKQRRNWSPELHKRFVNALHQLGGSHAATPKQIRELMKVDGLTNDEVKSHLQKYRLHTRRPSPTTIHNNGNPQAPQFVVVGGIWVQPPEYSAAVTATTTSGEVYAPMAAVPAVQPASSSQIQRLQKDTSSQSDERFSHGGYNAKISDFGLAKLGPSGGDSHVTTRVMGTYGYAAPEYIATGHLYVKSDVYGFGVVLLEMLTGLRALDTKRPSGQQNLVEWLKPSLSSKRKLKSIMDIRMEGQYSTKAALQAGQLTLKCLESDPKSRPAMKEVLEELEGLQAIKEKPKDCKTKSTHSTPHHHSQHPIHHRYKHHAAEI